MITVAASMRRQVRSLDSTNTTVLCHLLKLFLVNILKQLIIEHIIMQCST